MEIVILKGTVVGSGSVIGASSLVSKIFPSNSIGGGNPIKVLKIINVGRSTLERSRKQL